MRLPSLVRRVTWKDKANRIIAALSLEAYKAKNLGKKKHEPYTIPETASALIDCLNRDDERAAKSLMMYDYDAQRVANA